MTRSPLPLLGALLLGAGCDAGQTSPPAGPSPDFRFTLTPDGGAPAGLRGDSATWRNEGHPIHRVFRLVLHAPDAPAGFPDGAVRIEVGGYGSALAGGTIPTPGTWPVAPGPTALGTAVRMEIGSGWRGTAVAGALVIEQAGADVVTGSLDVELAVQEELEPRPAVRLRGRFSAVAWAD
jgi:hypothetical protein